MTKHKRQHHTEHQSHLPQIEISQVHTDAAHHPIQREESFQKVKNENRHPPAPAQHAPRIGGTNVMRTMLPQINPFETTDKVTEGDGSDEVRTEKKKDIFHHVGSIYHTPCPLDKLQTRATAFEGSQSTEEMPLLTDIRVYTHQKS